MMKKSLLLLLAAVSILLMALGGYGLYDRYSGARLNNGAALSFLDTAGHTLEALFHEEAQSALYLGYGGKTDFTPLERARKESDTRLQRLAAVAHSLPSAPNLHFADLKESLQYARSRIDVVTPEYRKILFDTFTHDIIGTLQKGISAVLSDTDLPEAARKLYRQSVAFSRQLSTEQSFIALILGRDRPFDAAALGRWEEMITSYRLPSGEYAAQIGLHPFAKELEFEKSMRDARMPILRYATTGGYGTTARAWIEKMHRWLERIGAFEGKIVGYGRYLASENGVWEIDPIWYVLMLLVGLIALIFSLRALYQASERYDEFPTIVFAKKRHTPSSEAAATLRASTTDEQTPLPLTNIHKEHSLDHMDAPETPKKLDLQTFDPVSLFSGLTDTLMAECERHRRQLAYKIDPALPALLRGDRQKLIEVVELPFRYLYEHTSSQNRFHLYFDRVAQKEHKTAVKITVCDEQCHIPEKERSAIVRSQFYKRDHHLQHDRSSPYAPLYRLAYIVHQLGGELTIDFQTPHGLCFVAMVDLETVEAAQVPHPATSTEKEAQ